jgi:environmental stress-induced protein Ves
MKPIDVDALPALPWKNGGGVTRTIAVSPPGAGLDNFDWRISIAEVASSGDFSRFPGVDRTILLLDGAGMVLESDGRVFPLTTPFDPHTFSGDDLVDSRLIDGATRDFNVMTRRGRSQADVKIWRSQFHATSNTAVFFCPRGTWRVDTVEVRAGQALLADHPKKPIRFVPQSPDAIMIAVLIKLEDS